MVSMWQATRVVAWVFSPVLVSGCLSQDVAQRSVPPEEPINLPVIALDQAIHVMTPEGQDAVLEPGRFWVSAASNTQLRLLADEDARVTIVAASPTTHDVTLDHPGAAIFADEENP